MAKSAAKKKPKQAAPNQAERFKAKARELVAVGELNLTEAGEVFEHAFKKIMRGGKRKPTFR